MAKDGTMRGGARIGSGKKRKSLDERIQEGTAAKARVLNALEAEPEGEAPIKDYLDRQQADGSQLRTREVMKLTKAWLKAMGCEALVPSQLVEQYALAVARWIQCEEYISANGYLGTHPTTGGVCQSPFVSMSKDYKKQMNTDWFMIWQIVKENSSVGYQGDPQDDMMEQLLGG